MQHVRVRADACLTDSEFRRLGRPEWRAWVQWREEWFELILPPRPANAPLDVVVAVPDDSGSVVAGAGEYDEPGIRLLASASRTGAAPDRYTSQGGWLWWASYEPHPRVPGHWLERDEPRRATRRRPDGGECRVELGYHPAAYRLSLSEWRLTEDRYELVRERECAVYGRDYRSLVRGLAARLPDGGLDETQAAALISCGIAERHVRPFVGAGAARGLGSSAVTDDELAAEMFVGVHGSAVTHNDWVFIRATTQKGQDVVLATCDPALAERIMMLNTLEMSPILLPVARARGVWRSMTWPSLGLVRTLIVGALEPLGATLPVFPKPRAGREGR